jgi:hypothetical protein
MVLAIHTNGVIVLRDGRRAINRYAPDGTLINSFSLGLQNAGSLDLVVANDHSLYVRGPFPAGGPSASALAVPAMLHYDTTGALRDSVVVRESWVKPSEAATQFTPRSAWYLLPDGRVYHARNDKVGFLVTDRNRTAQPLVTEVQLQPVMFSEEERKERQTLADYQQKARRASANAVVPEQKMPMRGTLTDIDGRIWFIVSTTGQKVEPQVAGVFGADTLHTTFAERPLFAAFQADGTFLGEVRFPMGTQIPSFAGSHAWALVPDENGVPALVKFRLRD